MPGWKSATVTSTYILLARIQSCDHTQPQGMLGNVVQWCAWEKKEMVWGNDEDTTVFTIEGVYL